MQAFAMIRIDRTPSKPSIGRRPHPSPVPGTSGLQFVSQGAVDGMGELLLLLSDILLGVAEDLGELGRWVCNARRERKNRGPALGRPGDFPQSFMKLGNTNQRQQVG